MPYRKRYRKKYRRKKGSGLVKQVYRNKRKLKMLEGEKKLLDQGTSITAITSTPSLLLVNGISEGSSSAERTGRSVRSISFFERCNYEINSSATAPQKIRHILFIDRQSNGAEPTPIEFFENLPYFLSPLKRGSFKRFKILIDNMITLSPNGTQGVTKKYYRKLFIDTQYKDSTAGSDAIETNTIWELFVSDVSTALTAPTIENSCRLKYVDN